MPKQSQREAPKKRKFSNYMFALFCVALLGIFAWLIVVQASRYNELYAQNSRIEADLEHERAVHASLLYRRANLDSDAYIEALARELLGWVRPNELVFRKVTN